MCTAGLPEGIDKDMSVILLVINVLAPGIGTLIAACLATECLGSTVAVGILQILTVPFLFFGWGWAIFWSVSLYKKADAKTAPAPQAQQHVVNPPPPPAAYQPTNHQKPHGQVPIPPQYPGAPPPQYATSPPPPAYQ